MADALNVAGMMALSFIVGWALGCAWQKIRMEDARWRPGGP